MKKACIALIAALYLTQITLCVFFWNILREAKSEALGAFAGVALAVLAFAVLLLIVVNIVVAVRGIKGMMEDTGRQAAVNRLALGMKLALIPFFLINFVIWGIISIPLMVVPGLIVALVFVLPIGIALTYLVLLTSSSYSIALIGIMRKNGHIADRRLALHVVLQLIFMLDVIDYIVLYPKFRKILRGVK